MSFVGLTVILIEELFALFGWKCFVKKFDTYLVSTDWLAL